MLRTFIAFDINDALRDECISLIYKGKGLFPDQIKWVIPENLHMTFLFLGEIKYDDKSSIENLLGDLADNLPSIDLYKPEIKWNPPYKPMTLWIEYSNNNPDFIHIRKKFIYDLKQELPYLKLDNKEFKWHLTLGRVRQHEQKKIDISKWRFDEEELPHSLQLTHITLYQSILQSYGPLYKNLISFPLKGGK